MKNQYVDVTHNRNNIFISYYDMETKEKKVAKVDKFRDLTLYNKNKNATEFKSFIGAHPLKELSFHTIKQYNEYIYEYNDISGLDIYGQFPIEKKWISSYYRGEITFDFDVINIGYFDIETTVSNMKRGIAESVELAEERITSMVLYATKSNTYYVFSDKHIEGTYFTEEDKKDATIKFYYFTPDIDGEIEMMEMFVKVMNEIEHIDILSAYFGNLFDFPYMYNRIARLSQEKHFSSNNRRSELKEQNLSPLNMAYKTRRGRVYIQGIQLIDYFDLYMKYTYGSPESWKLDFIAQKELGVGKIELEGGFMHVYRTDYEKYVYYNYIDVKRLRQLDEKLEFMNLHCEVSYLAKQNFEDTISPVRTWESIIFNHIKDKNMVINPEKFNVKKKYLGAYTHDPSAKFYNYINSYDLNSLYPHLFMMYYISPETLIPESELLRMFPDNESLIYILDLKKELEAVSNELPYDKKAVGNAYDRVGDMIIKKELDLSFIRGTDITMAPSLEFFRKKEDAVMPYLMEHFYDMRKVIKTKMLTMLDEIEMLKMSKNKTDDIEKIKEKYIELSHIDKMGVMIEKMQVLAKRWGLKEKAYKILLNSVYGAFGNAYFRFFDIRIAKSITAGGRLAIRSLIFSIERELRKLYQEFSGHEWKGSNFFIYSDTDSCKGDSKLKISDGMRELEVDIENLYRMAGGNFTLVSEELPLADRNISTESLNMITGEIEQHPINHIWRHKVKKEMFKIKTDTSEVIVTEDHSIIVKRDGKYTTVKPAEILSTDTILQYSR